ncbi:type IV secretion system protein VirB4 [Paraburkholderia sp. GAS33]|uniref:VirB4 family type IV secretion/conjugal transfer ATPase n=1 Tax=Paraburkholderia sp. GAS33 TaxID=3035130 RepID=UPI003D1AEEB8
MYPFDFLKRGIKHSFVEDTSARWTSQVLRRQGAVRDLLPKIGRPVSERVTSFEDGRAVLVIRLPGMPFESVNRREIENRFDALNRFFAAMAMEKGNRLALWMTLQRTRVSFAERYQFRSSFMQGFSEKYLARFRKDDYFENEFFVSAVLKGDDLSECVGELEELGDTMLKTLQAYDPEVLTTFERNGVLFSQPYQFIGALVNGVDEAVPVTQATGQELIPSSWLHFHYDTVEIRSDNATRFASCYDLKDFPKSGWGQLNPLLTLPVEFTLTQSFGCMGTYEAQKAIGDQVNKLKSVGDKATYQVKELADAQGLISGRELAFGDYHGALIVYGATAEQATSNGTFVTSRALNECGFRWVKATLSAPVTYMSQVPGYARKPRPMPKSTRNLASSFSMHNYSAGKAKGNPLGDGSAVMPLQTVSKGLYNFNFHASRLDEDSTGEKIAGHSMFLGATGTGKTTLQLALMGFLERFDPKIFAVDLDRGMQIFIESSGGMYFPLKAGEATGLAPFGLPDTPRNREFLYDLVGACGRDEDGTLSADDQKKVKTAVDTVYRIERVEDRCFSRLLESIPKTGENCLASRLAKWCHSEGGRFAWALDNAPDSMIDVTKERRIGFDVTDFLKLDYPPTEPVLAYLLHLKDLMQARGGLLATIIEEFWLAAMYPTTQKMILKVLKTGRKADEFMILVSQSPEDAINCPVFAPIRDQTATKIYLPNPDASRESYKKLNLTDRELEELLALSKESRTFLIKQSNQSAFAKMDLHGMADEIAVLSGSLDNVAIWEEARAESGDDLDLCMARFQARRKGKKAKPQEPSAAAVA